MSIKGKVLIGALASCTLATTAFAQARRDGKHRDPIVETMAEDSPGAGSDEDKLTAQDRQVLAWAKACGKRIEDVIAEWIKAGKVSKERMFAYLYFPIADTNPQKFNTSYDDLADQDIFPIQEECLAKSDKIKFVVTVDKNGYLPTHNQRYSQKLTGHKQIDLVNNRTKRIFDDRTGIRAARNENDFLLQLYFRDTGEVMKDLSVPIRIEGKHWGGLRFGYVSE
ncbi:MAG: chemotaxis protein [Deltaproteobacteria bacterium]|nr:chemotaxis protein [Deltaproteobacteria bacterium]